MLSVSLFRRLPSDSFLRNIPAKILYAALFFPSVLYVQPILNSSRTEVVWGLLYTPGMVISNCELLVNWLSGVNFNTLRKPINSAWTSQRLNPSLFEEKPSLTAWAVVRVTVLCDIFKLIDSFFVFLLFCKDYIAWRKCKKQLTFWWRNVNIQPEIIVHLSCMELSETGNNCLKHVIWRV